MSRGGGRCISRCVPPQSPASDGSAMSRVRPPRRGAVCLVKRGAVKGSAYIFLQRRLVATI